MKIFLIILSVVFLTSNFCFSQTFTMLNGDNGKKTTCSGTFVDDGGGGFYSKNQNSKITFCPSTPGDKVKINFTLFKTQGTITGPTPSCNDYLDVWFADAVGPLNSQNSRYCGSPTVPFTLTSTSPDGCISFQFISDATNQGSGWEATISCITPCTNPTASLAGLPNRDICSSLSLNPGSTTLNFDASGSTSSAGTNISVYEWTWGDGTSNTTTTPKTTHTFSGPAVYPVSVAVRDNNLDIDPKGCKSTNAASQLVRIMPKPSFTGTTASSVNINCGDIVTLNGSVTSQTKKQAIPKLPDNPVNLPDGGGVSYLSTLDFTGFFPAGAKMTPGCYPTLKFGLEHSYSKDITIELIAPTGQKVKVFDRVLNKNGLTSAFSLFGACSNEKDDGVPGCPATYTVVNSGGVAWSASNVTTTTTTPCSGYSGPCLTSKVILGTNSSALYFKPQTYNSQFPFSALDGADLNGIWTLKVTDNNAIDDGNLNGWSLDFPQSCFALFSGVTPKINTAQWVRSSTTGPTVPTHTFTSSNITDPGPDACPTSGTCIGNKLTHTSLIVGPFTTSGTYEYKLTATDEFGCNYDTTIKITVTCSGCNVSAGTTTNVCQNTSLNPNITHTTTGATGISNDGVSTGVNGLPAGISATWAANTIKISGTPSVSGTFNYSIPVTGTGCSPAKGTIIVNAKPTINLPASVCIGSKFQLTGSVPAATTNAWLSSVPANATVNVLNGEVTGIAVGTSDITYTDNNGCTEKGTITVKPLPPAPSAIIDCSSGPGKGVVSFTSPTALTDYQFSINDGAPLSYQASEVFSLVADGLIKLKVKEIATGCESPTTQENVDCKCPKPNDISISPTTGSTCGLTPKTISGTFSGDASEIKVSINIGSNGNFDKTFVQRLSPVDPPTNFSFTYTPDASDAGKEILIKLETVPTNLSLCSAATEEYKLMVNALPTASVTAGLDVCLNGSSDFTITGTSGATVDYKLNGGTTTLSATLIGAGTATVPLNNISADQTIELVSIKAGACPNPLSKIAVVKVKPDEIPTFDELPPICINEPAPTLPPKSLEDIEGSWNPSTVSNLNTGTYTFTPKPIPGRCFVTTPLTVTVNTNPVEPEFDLIPPVCINSSNPPELKTESNNNIKGTWQPSVVSTQFSGETTYKFTPTPGQCAATTTLKVKVLPNPVVDAGPPRIDILEGESVTLNGVVSGTSDYVWTPDQNISDVRVRNPVVNPSDDITYKLTATTSDGCEAEDEVLILVLKELIIPNIFSPNGDGINDRFEIENIEKYKDATVEIFNRYGQRLIRFVGGYTNPWDGKVNGEYAPVGTYFYVITPNAGKRKVISGSISIVR